MAKAKGSEWRASAAQLALFPEVSGNDINGLGEPDFRRPTVVYWPDRLDFDSIAHGAMCQFMITQQAPEVNEVYGDRDDRAPTQLDPVAATRLAGTPEKLTETVKKFALAHEADLVGVARLDPDWFFDHHAPPDFPWVVMIGGAMKYDEIKTAPPTMDDPSAALEVARVYNRVDRAAGALANWIRGQGYRAENQGGPMSGAMTLVPAAIECGFGELGKHGSIINRELGALLRLSAVRTDMPLVPDAPDDFGADGFCESCRVCANACPPAAMFDDKQTVRGKTRWYVDFDKCVPYFNENQGCAICLAVCPWSRPGIAPKLVVKMARRRGRA